MTKTVKITEMSGLFHPQGENKPRGADFRNGATPETAAALLSVTVAQFAALVNVKPAKLVEMLDVAAVKLSKGEKPAKAEAGAKAPAAKGNTTNSNPDNYQINEVVNAKWGGTDWKCKIDSINGTKVNVTWDSDGTTGEVKMSDLSRIGGKKTNPAAVAETPPAHDLRVGQTVRTTYKDKSDGQTYTAKAKITALDEASGKATLTWIEGGGKLTRKFEDCKSVGGRPPKDQESAAA